MEVNAVNLAGFLLITIASSVIFAQTVAPFMATHLGASIIEIAVLWMVAGTSIIIGNELS